LLASLSKILSLSDQPQIVLHVRVTGQSITSKRHTAILPEPDLDDTDDRTDLRDRSVHPPGGTGKQYFSIE
jgi:hypothetical protein